MDWKTIFDQAGILAGILFLILVSIATAAWRIWVWSSTNVILPLVKRQIDFMDSVEKSVLQGNEAMQAMVDVNRQHAEHAKGIDEQLKAVDDRQETILAAIKAKTRP